MFRVEIPVDGLTRKRLPAICPITGETSGLVYRKVEFNWSPRWTNGFLLGGVLMAMLAESLTNKRAKGEMPFTRLAWWRWKLGEPLMLFAGIGGLISVLCGIIAFGMDSPVWALVLVLGGVGVPLAIWWRLLRKRTVVVVEITNDVLILDIPSERAAMALVGQISGAALKLSPAEARAMQAAATKTTHAPERTGCAYHPDTLAAWCCGRCGSFFCPRCAEHPTKGANPVCSRCFNGG